MKFLSSKPEAVRQRRRCEEWATQVALFKWASYAHTQYPELVLMFHIPNGGKRNLIEATRLKAAGVKAGVPDIFLPVQRKQFGGLFLELKSAKGKSTINQSLWQNSLQNEGYVVAVCHDLDEIGRAHV